MPDTLRRAAPLTYERAGAGWLVLLFKVMVIVLVVSGIGRYLKDEDASASRLQGPSILWTSGRETGKCG